MNHEALVNLMLGFNGTVLVIGLTAFYKCHDRTGMFEHSFKTHPLLLQKIKEKIFTQLSLAIKPLFTQPRDAAIKIICSFEPGGSAWQEGSVDTQETEAYRNALNAFVNDNIGALAVYRNVSTMINKCSFWADYLSWSIFALLVVQLLSMLVFGVIDKVCGKCIEDHYIITFLFLQVVMIVNCLLPLPFSLYYHKRIDTHGKKYV